MVRWGIVTIYRIGLYQCDIVLENITYIGIIVVSMKKYYFDVRR